jgi:hypothetical protein
MTMPRPTKVTTGMPLVSFHEADPIELTTNLVLFKFVDYAHAPFVRPIL